LGKRTNKNSVLFFAAIGVYLALLAAGASPETLRDQAAITKCPEIWEGIEVDNDADRYLEPSVSASAGQLSDPLSFSFLSFFQSLFTSVDVSAESCNFELFKNEILISKAWIPSHVPILTKITISNLARAGI
jgi:hypothetical protein